MPRPAKPWYRRGRGQWYVTHKGRLTPLGVKDPEDSAGAHAAFRRLLDGTGTLSGLAPAKCTTVSASIARYLAGMEARAAAGKISLGHLRNTRILLEQFADAFPDAPVSRLTADQVEGWVLGRPWSSSYQHDAVGVLTGWLRTEGVNLRLKKPRKRSRGAATCLTDEQFDAVIRDLTTSKAKRGDLAQLLRLLRETGARPDEACGLTVEGIDWLNRCARLSQHKTEHVTGEDRILHFNTAAMMVLERQRATWRTGLLFRSKAGKRYSAATFGPVLRQLSRRVGFRVIAYGLGRHGFATNLLAAGVSDAIVAELLGQKGTKMVHQHYAHLGQRAQALKAAAELASRRPQP